MISKKAMYEVFDLAEEDYTPLFDVTGTFEKYMPSITEDALIDAARSFVREYLARGYLRLVYDCWAKSTEDHRHVEDLGPEEMEDELENRSNWLYHEPREPDQRWVAICTTPAGEKAMSAGEFYEM